MQKSKWKLPEGPTEWAGLLTDVFGPSKPVLLQPELSKHEVLKALLTAIVETGSLPADQASSVLLDLIRREAAGTTAIGKGLALPHAGTRDVHRLIGAVGIAPAGIQFSSLDGSPTKLVLLLIYPPDCREDFLFVTQHLIERLRRNAFWLPDTPEKLADFWSWTGS